VILSGLVEADVPQVVRAYSERLGYAPSQVLELNEWRAVVFEPRN
jgi:ribosomal protein L11 methylase PrmA